MSTLQTSVGGIISLVENFAGEDLRIDNTALALLLV
jgi:hypothetical protein